MTKETIEYLPVAAIDTAPQVRENAVDDSIRNLAVTLREVGLQQPIRVRRNGNRLVVVDGERRLHAARLLKWDRIAAIVEERDLSGAEIVQLQLIANLLRKNLSGMETARAIDGLMKETSWSATEVAGKLGISIATVSKLRALLDLPCAVQEQVQNGSLAPSTAYALGKIADPAEQTELVHQAANGQLTRDAANVKAKRQSRPRKGRKRSRPCSITAAVANRRVSVSGAALNGLPEFIAVLEELVGRAKAAQSEGIELDDFLKTLKAKSAA